ncbi:hypothetical protein [Mycolicibacterium litorale]|uniref:Uncharacterized protein n=1 Tax=Mycolicibacterium litorale TaxID=758802 RepID=A0AAD1MRX1_9MYCO|nr:hypothetical protein [Mycolicibacterium litorale]BBY15270.1 hypothetical protein MLIT_08620 [Mycolicibacterium litorale]
MIDRLTDAQTVGLAVVILGVMFAVGWLVRSDFGQSQGNVATGFVLADMVDPARRTSTANDYGYKQLAYEPIFGGGLITALSVPLITEFGLPAITVASVILLLATGVWGIRRRGLVAADTGDRGK